MITRRIYNRVMRGEKPKRASWDRQQRATGFDENELVWIIKRCGNASTKESRVPGKIKAVLVTRFWVEYLVGDTYHFNKYYPYQLEKRGKHD